MLLEYLARSLLADKSLEYVEVIALFLAVQAVLLELAVQVVEQENQPR
jgi:hypothetical protein